MGRRSDPLSLNLYTYCRNNPIRFIDPSGHSYAALPDGTSMSINSASDAKKFEEKKASMKKKAPGCGNGYHAKFCGSTNDYGPFDTADEAALSFSIETYSSSLYVRHEYSSIIYSAEIDNQVLFYYTEPSSWWPHDSYINTNIIPEDTMAVAYVHTHPNSTDFSKTDKDIANSLSINAYMAGHDYKLHKYEYELQLQSIVDDFLPIALNQYEMSDLEIRFGMSWKNHIEDGKCPKDFNCANIPWPTPMEPIENN